MSVSAVRRQVAQLAKLMVTNNLHLDDAILVQDEANRKEVFVEKQLGSQYL